MTRTLTAILLLIASFAVFGAEGTPSEQAEAFLQQVGKGESDQAFDKLLSGTGMAELKPQAVVALKGQAKAALGVYGTAIGMEKILDEELSPSLKRVVYLQKFPVYPVTWEMYFYRAKDHWALAQVVFSDQMGPLIGRKK